MEDEKVQKIEQHQVKLSVPLTDVERIQKGKELAQAHQELESHELKANEAKASLKAEKTAIEARIQALAAAIRAGSETRDVWVYGVADIPASRVRFFREDTGEFVKERAIMPEERQVSIPGTERPISGPRAVPDITEGPADTVADEDHGTPQSVRAKCGHMVPFDGNPSPEKCVACETIQQDELYPPRKLEVIDATEEPPAEEPSTEDEPEADDQDDDG